MLKKTGKFKSIDGKQTMTVTIEDGGPADSPADTTGGEVEAYQATSSETFSIVNPDGRILTITIAE